MRDTLGRITAHPKMAFVFGSLIGLVLLSLVVTLLLQLGFSSFWPAADIATPMVLAQAGGIGAALLVSRWTFDLPDRWPLPSGYAALFALMAGALFQFPLSVVGGWVQLYFPIPAERVALLEKAIYPDDAFFAWSAAVGIGCIVPLFEEALYRGVVLALLRRHLRWGWSLGISALLFGFAHVAPHAVIAATLAGGILGWLYLRGGFWIAAAFHMGVNLVPFVLRPTWVPIEGFNDGSGETPIDALIWLPALVSGVFLLFVAQRRCANRNERESPRIESKNP